MPLIQGKSDKAMKENIKSEMHAGKPQKQAVAIAYAVKRKMQHKAKGGVIENEKLRPEHDAPSVAKDLLEHELKLPIGYEEHDVDHMDHPMETAGYTGHPDIDDAGDGEQMGFYAHGGMMHPKAMAKAIMMKKYAQGGMVDPDMDQHDDYLSDEMQTGLPSEAPQMKKKRMISDILAQIKYKNMGVPHS